MPLESDADKHVWVNRVKAIPGSVDSWISSLKAGIASGNVASKRQATEVAKQCQEYADATYFSPTAAGISDEAVQAALDAENSFVTAADFLVNVYEPVANAADGIGLEKYIRASRKWNGCDIDPHELFMWGWHELDRITERMQHITSQLDPTAKIADIRDILNTDPRYVIHGEENIVRFLEELTKKTTQVMAEKHFDIPDSIRICEVKLAGPGSAAAPYYMPPSEDLSRPGSTWLPTLGSAEFHSWGLVSTWYHEAVPGHHLQVGSTVINKDQLSRYQRTFGWTSGYGEGWALYAERLMDELGYFEDPGYEMGFLCAQALRAARIVVDIGMHLGWSVPEGQKWEPVGQLIDFDFSVEFLQRRALETPEFAISETIRYLGLPAQAISYKLGERTILQARQDAMARHGDAFDLKAWHKALLDLGPVGLDTLVEQMASF
jgi:uncharacterized protein (DUF885 family)